MASVVVCGGGVVGLCTALLLARDGHEVTVLEADPTPPPADPAAAWDGWQRAGVAQFHQPHTMLARFRAALKADLPDVLDRLLAAGCVDVDLLAELPPGIADTAPRDGDDRLHLLAGRRPVVESAVARVAGAERGLTLRRGVRVAGLLAGAAAVPGVPHVTGVVTRDGERITADVVVDAMGRRSPAADWLAALGARLPAPESSGRGFTYYSRWFTGPEAPVIRGPANLAVGSFSLLALPADARTWSITLFTLTADAPLKALRFPEVFDRVVAAVPLRAHLLDGERLTGVLPMAGVLNQRRRFAVDGTPAVTGYAPLSDAWACTNPSGGRGLSVGLVHGLLLRPRRAHGRCDDRRGRLPSDAGDVHLPRAAVGGARPAGDARAARRPGARAAPAPGPGPRAAARAGRALRPRRRCVVVRG